MLLDLKLETEVSFNQPEPLDEPFENNVRK